MTSRYISVFKKTALFDNIEFTELDLMLNCLKAAVRHYKKGDALLTAGSRPEHMGILLLGRLCVVRDDIDGNRTLLTVLESGGIFAEALCCAGVTESPVSVIADTDSEVLLFQFSRVLQTCPSSCRFHRELIANMLRLVARMNLYLQNRMQLIGQKSVRSKVLSYLDTFAVKRGLPFSIPLNRAEMADYLCVDRSALSHELMRMKRDGLIDYNKNKFTLLY